MKAGNGPHLIFQLPDCLPTLLCQSEPVRKTDSMWLLSWNMITWPPSPQWNYSLSYGNQKARLRLFRNHSTYGINAWPKNYYRSTLLNQPSIREIYFQQGSILSNKPIHCGIVWPVGLHKHMLNQTLTCSSSSSSSTTCNYYENGFELGEADGREVIH